jgi:hypothetical protein
MKKATKPAVKKPTQKSAAKKLPVKPKPRQAVSQRDLLVILERMAESAERLTRAAEQMAAAAAAQLSAAAGSQQETERQDEGAGEVVGVMVVDESNEE